MARDAVELIGALGADRAYLIGNDWGAGAVVGATALAPEKVIKLVTIASGRVDRELSLDFQYLQGTWHGFFFQRPDAEEAVAHNDYAFVEEWWRWASPEWDIPAESLESIRSTFRKPGVVQAALGLLSRPLRRLPGGRPGSRRPGDHRSRPHPRSYPCPSRHP